MFAWVFLQLIPRSAESINSHAYRYKFQVYVLLFWNSQQLHTLENVWGGFHEKDYSCVIIIPLHIYTLFHLQLASPLLLCLMSFLLFVLFQELKEEFTRILTANNPHAPQNIVRYSFKVGRKFSNISTSDCFRTL